MPMVDDEDYLSDVNNPFKPEMDEQNLETPGRKIAEKCNSIPELGDSFQSAGGGREETVSLEVEPMEAKGGGEGLLANQAAEGETEFIVDTVAEMNELVAVVTEEVATAEEGGCEMIAAQSEDPPLETKAKEESSPADDAKEDAVITDAGDAPMFTELKVDTEVDELLVGMELETKTEEEFAPAVDTNLEMAVSGSEPQIVMKANEEFSPVVEPNEEVVVNDVGDAQQLSELQVDARGDGFQAVMDGKYALDNKSEGQVSDAKNNEADYQTVDGMDALDNKSEGQVNDGKNNEADNQTSHSWVVENNTERVVEGDEVDEEKVDPVVNDSEAGTTEKPADFEEEKVDMVITEEIPVAGVEMNVKMVTEVNSCVVDTGEQEQVHVICEHAEDQDVTAEDSLMSGTKILEDESMSMEVLGGSMLDETVNMAENKDAVVEEDFPKGDIEAETEKGVELELTRNILVDDTQLDETEILTYKTSDEDDGKMETDDTNSDADEPGHESPAPLGEEEDETMVAEGETGTQDTEMETELDNSESGKTSGGKRKRGKLSKSPFVSKATTKASSRKTVGEDVCFICFDGGELVLCDRRGCPKAYHPSCVNRDEAFFKSKGRWNCGWHLCSTCEKNARYMCFTCTFSLCKSCIKDAVILCVRGNKGFCETCLRTVKLIENNEQGNTDTQVDFDDRSSWEYLFKDYYLELKAKLSLSVVEIAEAKNPWKGADMLSGPSKQESSEARDANDVGSGSDDSIENIDTARPKRRKMRKLKSRSREEELVSTGVAAGNCEWASKEVLELVSHMKDGDTSFLSQFDVQALLLDYIKRNKLRDPRKKSQIICDARLEKLFGKPRVGHFEMLKLLESHFLVRDEPHDDFQGSVVDTENNQLDVDGNADPVTRGGKDRKRKSRKKSDRGPQSNLDDYAAIDMHNIGLIYLRRKLMEDLLEDAETFHDKVIGTFVRIRIFGSNQKQDLYRLVPVEGTSKATEPYKIGKKSTDTMVEILNLGKTEIISIDTISNQEFTEDECKRLRQSIKCGLIRRLTVGEILDKTMEIQVARVNDWLESEVLRLSHLRDRASDLGRRKELRECVEKLQLLKTPEERRRRLEEIPEIHADPKMDPCYESDDNDSENEDSRRDAFMRSKGFSRRGRAPISPGSDNSTKITSKDWESVKYLSSSSLAANASHIGEIVNENSWNLERDKGTEDSYNLENQNYSTNFESGERVPHPVSRPESSSGVTSVLAPQSSFSSGVVETAVKINESEKIWHYKDPSGKVQGPFSIVQLRKWNNTGYFPSDLRIWKATEKQDNSVLLTDALEGKFPKQSPAIDKFIPVTNTLHSLHQDKERSKLPAEKWLGSDTTNLPSPTPKQSIHSGWDVEERRGGSGGAIHQTPGGANGMLSSPTPVLPNIGTHSSVPVIQTAPFSPTPNSQEGNLLNPTAEQPAVSPHAVQMHTRPQAPVQPVTSQNPQGYGWGTPNVPQNSSGSFSNVGTPTGLQPDVWRSTQGSQTNMSSPATPNASWGMWPPENNTPVGVLPENPNMGWGMVQSNNSIMGWGNLPPGGNSTNMNWGPPPMPVPVPGNASSSWVAPPGNNTAGANHNHGLMPGYVNPGWGGPPPVQGPVVGNGWGPPSGNAGTPPGPPPAVQGQPPQGITNHGSSWGGGGGAEQNHMGGQFSGPRGSRGRDSGFGGRPRPWNRQSSHSGGSSRKRDMVCPYNSKGRCIKGVHCDYLHT